jgi:DNA gyrase subunit B
MYIGDTDDGSGLHHMVYEVVDNAIDEALAGHATLVEVTLNPEGSATVTDDGRGIPVDMHEGEGVSAAEVIMTQLHAGGKFDQNSYKVSGGLHGVGVSVVNALSDWLDLKIHRNGQVHEMRFARGDAVSPLVVTGTSPLRANGQPLTGTSVTFMPSLETFSQIEFDRKTLEHRLRELAFLNSGVTIRFKDLRGPEPYEEVLSYDGGVEAFVRHIDKTKQAVLSAPITIRGKRERSSWSSALVERQLPRDHAVLHQQHPAAGRGHPPGRLPRGADARGGRLCRAERQEDKSSVTGEDAREGMTCVLSVKVPDPKFSSQTKDKLVSSEVRPLSRAWSPTACPPGSRSTPSRPRRSWARSSRPPPPRGRAQGARADPAQDRARHLQPARQARRLPGARPGQVRAFIGRGRLRRRLGQTGAQPREPGRPAAPGQDPERRARPLRQDAGLRAGRHPDHRAGRGIGRDDFNADKLRYHKIVIMTDADVDGAHIRTLLLTFFYRQMPELIERGYL